MRCARPQPLYGGDLFYASHARHYGATELTLIARQQDALAYHPHAVLVEVDDEEDGRAVDEADRALFWQRATGAGVDGRVVDAGLLGAFRGCYALWSCLSGSGLILAG